MATSRDLNKIKGVDVSVGAGAQDTGTQRVVLASDGLPRVTPEPQTANACSTSSAIGANSDNATVVKASAGNVYAIVAFNKNASPVYLKLYNKATTPTNGDTPIKRYMIPGGATGAGFVITHPMGVSFSAGISYRLVTGIADNDNTSVTASEQLINIDYK